MECAQHFTERELAHCYSVARLQEVGRGGSRGVTNYQQPWEGTVKSLHDTLLHLADARRGGATEDPRQKMLGLKMGYWSFQDQAWVVWSEGGPRQIVPTFQEDEWELYRKGASGGRMRRAASMESSRSKRHHKVVESSSSGSSGNGDVEEGDEVPLAQKELSDDEVEPGTRQERRVRHDA